MNGPQHLVAFDLKPGDYEWTRVQPPAEPTPTAPMETEFYCRDANGQLVEAGEFFKRYAEGLLADPRWQAENERRAKEKAARSQARLERIEERRRSKEEVKR